MMGVIQVYIAWSIKKVCWNTHVQCFPLSMWRFGMIWNDSWIRWCRNRANFDRSFENCAHRMLVMSQPWRLSSFKQLGLLKIKYIIYTGMQQCVVWLFTPCFPPYKKNTGQSTHRVSGIFQPWKLASEKSMRHMIPATKAMARGEADKFRSEKFPVPICFVPCIRIFFLWYCPINPTILRRTAEHLWNRMVFIPHLIGA